LRRRGPAHRGGLRADGLQVCRPHRTRRFRGSPSACTLVR
jgi:hypothetical protein